MKSLVIIPTYNEKENVEKIVGQITGKGFYLLVIDDNSPDGTGDILENLKIKNEKLEVIHREKNLGSVPRTFRGSVGRYKRILILFLRRMRIFPTARIICRIS